MRKKHQLSVLFPLILFLISCGDPEQDEDDLDVETSNLAETYQYQRPFDENRLTNKYDPNMPALHVAEHLGSYVPGSAALKSAGDTMYTIDAVAVSMGGKCFRKTKGVPSKRSQWGVKSGTVQKIDPVVFTKENFATQRAKWHDVVITASVNFEMDPNIIHGIITQESGYNPEAFNKGSSATGMMQIIPMTQKGLGMAPGDAWIGEKNIYYGTKYFSQLHRRFKGNTALALAGYNAGPGHVDWCGDAIPPFKETQDYVARITGYANVYAKSNPVKKSNDRKNK